MKLRYKMEQSVHSTYEGFASLVDIVNVYQQCKPGTEIVLDFHANTWFDSNLLPVIYAIVEWGRKNDIHSLYSNQRDCKLHKLLMRNGFGKFCFDLPYTPLPNETVIPFKVFKASDTYLFGAYMDEELVGYFPDMDWKVKRCISSYIQELFGNAQIHGVCSQVYTCGQYYVANHKMDFTIVNLGRTFQSNVVSYLTEIARPLPENSISWAVEPNHSTKRDTTGGLGLTLMRDFINYNHGKFQIVSGNEFWQLSNGEEVARAFPNDFPGTIVNIEIDQNDKSIYNSDLLESTELLF